MINAEIVTQASFNDTFTILAKEPPISVNFKCQFHIMQVLSGNLLVSPKFL